MKLTRKQLEQQVREALKKRTLNENETPAEEEPAQEEPAQEEPGAGSSLFADGDTFLGMEPDEVAIGMGTPDATFNVAGLGEEEGEFFTGATEPNPAGGGSSGFVRTFDDRHLAAQAPAGNLNQRAREARRSGKFVHYDELPINRSAYQTDPDGRIRVTRGKFRGAFIDPATMPSNAPANVRVTPDAQARRDAARRIAHGSYQTQQGSGRSFKRDDVPPAKVEDSKPRRSSLADKIMNPDPLGHLQERRGAMERRRSRVSLPPKTPAMQAIYERAAMGDRRLRFMFEHAVAGNAKAQQFLNALAETLTKSQILKEQEAAPEPPHDPGPPKTDEGLNIDALVEELESVGESVFDYLLSKRDRKNIRNQRRMRKQGKLTHDDEEVQITGEEVPTDVATDVPDTGHSDRIHRRRQMDQIDDDVTESQDPLKRMRDLALKSYGSYKYED